MLGYSGSTCRRSPCGPRRRWSCLVAETSASRPTTILKEDAHVQPG
ncbi:hypothetical protein COLSTE_00718 [Collinsella stercoris DSM 13279]|uniref:Uncharacterized protein n=1 Tax=Collinsella stercoris DSM 13279 TaxID=445975 RepID=B6G9H7_9ACTN|nr:hypothetical protein COLSTE_00718 [Collinsella stercoris DSM 13279]